MFVCFFIYLFFIHLRNYTIKTSKTMNENSYDKKTNIRFRDNRSCKRLKVLSSNPKLKY